jgi:SAM-dependent methyltransferase
MRHAWKYTTMAKGVLTYVPPIDWWRRRRAATGGTASARYCYSVWLRHLVVLGQHGFRIAGASVGELGPGDSIGIGLAAMLSGAYRYVGLDVVPYAAKADLLALIDELARLYAARAPIPDDQEFPRVRPWLSSYGFPEHLVAADGQTEAVRRVKAAVAHGLREDGDVAYRAPWTGTGDIRSGSLDLVYSQAVLQYVDNLELLYRTTFRWLKPGGLCSHATGLGANDLSPYWNGHWAYSEGEWRVARGRREYFLNREPLSVHLRLAREAGFEVLQADAQRDTTGLQSDELASPFTQLDDEDRHASGVMLVLRKPPSDVQ